MGLNEVLARTASVARTTHGEGGAVTPVERAAQENPSVETATGASARPAVPALPALPARVHGGPDAAGVPSHDFSTCSNACGPCPSALAAVQQADARHYPDAGYVQLRAQLAAFHAVEPVRVLLAASGSEFIQRVTALVAQRARQPGANLCAPAAAPVGCAHTMLTAVEAAEAGKAVGSGVWVPSHAYGDYVHAARAWGLPLVAQPDDAALVWACEPSSPLGQAHTEWPAEALMQSHTDGPSAALTRLTVLDRVYAPLRLSGAPSLRTHQLDQLWQLFSPNKALGLTGIRAAYVIAPCASSARARSEIDAWIAALNGCAPSWPLGAHGVALLQAWVTPEAQAWLSGSLHTLRAWKANQVTLLQAQGWQVAPSQANYFCARPPHPIDLAALRARHSIKLRDCTSFGLPGWFRLGVLGPLAQAALQQALTAWMPAFEGHSEDGVPE